MFDGVKSNPLLPILDEDYVANRVVDAIQHNDEVQPACMLITSHHSYDKLLVLVLQHLVMPWIVNLVYLTRLLPVPVMDLLSNALGVTKVR